MPSVKRKEKSGAPLSERGSRLAEIRSFFNLSQEQLANWLYEDETDPLSQPQQAASQWEKGRRPMPYEKVALKLGVSVDWLMGFSSEMWGARIFALRSSLRSYLSSLPADRQSHLQSPKREPADRMRVVVEFLQSADPSLITDRFLASMLTKGNVSALAEILRADTYADISLYEKFAAFVALPTAWFELGNPGLFKEATVEPYRCVIAECVAKGISPERLGKLIAAIS